MVSLPHALSDSPSAVTNQRPAFHSAVHSRRGLCRLGAVTTTSRGDATALFPTFCGSGGNSCTQTDSSSRECSRLRLPPQPHETTTLVSAIACALFATRPSPWREGGLRRPAEQDLLTPKNRDKHWQFGGPPGRRRQRPDACAPSPRQERRPLTDRERPGCRALLPAPMTHGTIIPAGCDSAIGLTSALAQSSALMARLRAERRPCSQA